jgi:predicted aminopeptidase
VAVERIGGRRWLTLHAGEAARAEVQAQDRRREDFSAFAMRWRRELEAIYGAALDDAAKRERKAEAMARMRAEYQALKAERWGGHAGYDGWMARANNASLGVMAAYNELVPQFEGLFERCDGDFERFYGQARRLAALPRDMRRAALGPAAPSCR